MFENRAPIVITSHRGCSGLAPENSMTSILKGLEYSVERIEIDVHQTKDNVLVAIHDKTINRTTNGKGSINRLTYDHILQYSLKNAKKSEIGIEKIPTLEQIVKLINGNSKLLIEIKNGSERYPNIEERIIELINKHNANKWCIIQSFDINVLKKIQSLNHEIELHLLCICKIPLIPFWVCRKLEFDILKYSFIQELSICKSFINKKLINLIHNKNKKINGWTLNNPQQASKLIELGIDGIITDYPNLFIKQD